MDASLLQAAKSVAAAAAKLPGAPQFDLSSSDPAVVIATLEKLADTLELSKSDPLIAVTCRILAAAQKISKAKVPTHGISSQLDAVAQLEIVCLLKILCITQ